MVDLLSHIDYVVRAQPIILLLDVSDSMNKPPVKIDSLNAAVSEMIDDFKQMPGEVDYVVSVITFGGKVTCLYDPLYKNVKEIQWTELKADGNTPMGKTYGCLYHQSAFVKNPPVCNGNRARR